MTDLNNLTDPLIGLPLGANPAINQTKTITMRWKIFSKRCLKRGHNLLLHIDLLLDVRETDVIMGLLRAPQCGS